MIKYLFNNGYKTISTKELYRWYIREVEYDEKTILITIDDGFYEDYYLAYPIIKKYKFKATSFVVGSRLKDKTQLYNKYKISYIGIDVINKVRKEYPNFEFQSHSFNRHSIFIKNSSINFPIKTFSKIELENDILKMKQFGFNVMAYPYGVFNEEIKKILEKNRYLISFRFGPPKFVTRKSDRFAINRIKISGEDNLDTLKKWLN